MATRVLIVEDDEHVRTSLRLALEQEGNDVSEAVSAEEGLPAFRARPSDVVLVDIMLPGANGFELCRDLRRESDVPILVLTARSDSHDVVAALEAGADDYVVKPAVPKELAARIRALLRRASRAPSSSPCLTVGELTIEPDRAEVRRRGEVVPLTKTEFRLLCELADMPGRVLTREMLLERVWGYDYFGDSRLVDVHVRRLRRKIEDDPGQPRWVITVRGLGYKVDP
ncbi:MAG: response regulator transcription factor [Actinomycetota bacterium]